MELFPNFLTIFKVLFDMFSFLLVSFDIFKENFDDSCISWVGGGNTLTTMQTNIHSTFVLALSVIFTDFWQCLTNFWSFHHFLNDLSILWPLFNLLLPNFPLLFTGLTIFNKFMTSLVSAWGLPTTLEGVGLCWPRSKTYSSIWTHFALFTSIYRAVFGNILNFLHLFKIIFFFFSFTSPEIGLVGKFFSIHFRHQSNWMFGTLSAKFCLVVKFLSMYLSVFRHVLHFECRYTQQYLVKYWTFFTFPRVS